MFYPKNVFKKYRYNEKYKVAADHVLTLKCIGDKQFKFKYCDWIVARFNTGGATENGDTIFEIEKENLFIEHLGYIPHLRYRIRKFKEDYRKRRVSVRQTMNKP